MNVVYVSNEKYAPHLAASICSLLENNREEADLHVYVISTGLTPESQGKLRAMTESYGDDSHIRRLITLRLEDLARKMKIGPEHQFLTKFDVSILGRFFLGELLPEFMRKVIYLDGDTIISGSLRELYNMLPFDGDIIAAGVMEPTIYQETRDMLGLSPQDPYFNSGVLLIDMDKWHNGNIDYALRKYYDTISRESVFADQDAINGLLRGRIMSVDPKFNFFTNYYYRSRDSLVSLSPAYESVTAGAYEAAKASPVVIHFSGDERPWYKGNHNPYAEQYHKYLALTPWKDTPQQSGREMAMQAYHAMNVLTGIAPWARDAISRQYGARLHDEKAGKTEEQSNT